jgi:hypothetical protein
MVSSTPNHNPSSAFTTIDLTLTGTHGMLRTSLGYQLLYLGIGQPQAILKKHPGTRRRMVRTLFKSHQGCRAKARQFAELTQRHPFANAISEQIRGFNHAGSPFSKEFFDVAV